MAIEKECNQKIVFIEIKGCLYKAKVKKLDNLWLVYIFNFNKSFKINLNKANNVKNEAIVPSQKTTNIFADNLTSPLAGRVIKINVTPGQFVKQNQPLIVIESMKMENELRATCNTFIKSLLIAYGDLVKQNQILMTFESRGVKNAKTKNSNEQKKI